MYVGNVRTFLLIEVTIVKQGGIDVALTLILCFRGVTQEWISSVFEMSNVFCGAVPTVFVSTFLTNKQQKNMKKQQPQLGFTFTTSLDVVLLMVEFQ